VNKISSIEKHLTTEFEKKLFAASVSYLSKLDDPLRLNSFSYSMRELYEHILSRLSPRDQIINCTWFKPENERNDPTRKQQLKYAVQKGLEDDYVENNLNVSIDEFWPSIRKMHNSLSQYTHVDEITFDTSEKDCDNFSNKVLNSLLEILDLISSTRDEILDNLYDDVSEVLIQTCAYRAMGGIDILSNNSYVEDVQIENYEITSIDSEEIYFEGVGTASVSLNYNDGEDGTEISLDFPFKFTCLSSVLDPVAIQLTEGDIEIDISSWSEDEFEDNYE
jgi:Predicted pPIWI-associating nuclease